MAMNGVDVMLLVNTGVPAVPVYEAVGQQRDVTFNETTAEIDASNKNDGRGFRVLPGRYKATLSLDSLYIDDDAGYLALQAAMRDGELILVARELEGAAIETAEAVITSLSETFPDQDVGTVSCSLTIDDMWCEVGT